MRKAASVEVWLPAEDRQMLACSQKDGGNAVRLVQVNYARLLRLSL